MRWCRTWGIAMAGTMLPLAAIAQVDASVAIDSDYRFRGVSLSESNPSLRLTVNDDISSSWYVGASATRVEPARGDRYAQLLGYAGWVSPVIDGRQLEFGISDSRFTGNSGYDFAEPYAGLLAEHWAARLYYAPDYFGRGVRTLYGELNGHLRLGVSSRLFGHVGLLLPLDGAEGPADRSRRDLRLGAGVVWRNLDLQIAWVAATRGGPYPAVFSGHSSAVVAGASYSF